ncbi:MAG: hypothetical protein QUT27_12140 [candidate division Zixibacteria bacterium]|nr:hypothetical protein [candidate division Zixibacteria bacterium]
MRLSRGWHLGMLAVWLAGSGCTALREIPRADYVERVPERPVRIVTRAGDSYELETARIEADSLVGFRRLDVEGAIEEFAVVRVPLDEVASISARRIDWYRTGLLGGAGVAAIVLGAARSSSNGATNTIPDCPRCP